MSMGRGLARRAGYGSRKALCCAVVASLAWGCVYRAPIADPRLLDQLGLLEPGAVMRATIEARLGPPEQAFEGGSIGAYRLVNIDGLLVSHGPARPQAHSRAHAHYWLMLQYGLDGLLVRRSLVSAPPEPEG